MTEGRRLGVGLVRGGDRLWGCWMGELVLLGLDEGKGRVGVRQCQRIEMAGGRKKKKNQKGGGDCFG